MCSFRNSRYQWGLSWIQHDSLNDPIQFIQIRFGKKNIVSVFFDIEIIEIMEIVLLA